ncbi:MAG TPA: maleylpyruvate isomerase family mycothiol-dependent enzyme, partial [Streptosporangiaceae bacterium]
NADLLADFRSITAERLASLRAMPVADFNAPSWTPAGNATYARFMQIRIFDCWMHEQDIRAALGTAGNEGGPIAEQALHEVVLALGYIVGKRGGAPDGSRVRISLTGPIERDLYVVVDGRAKVTGTLDGEPTATLTMPSSLFLRLAGGREDAQAALGEVELGGDAGLARQLAVNLAYTI